MEPYLFFAIVDRLGMNQSLLAREMGITKGLFSRVKHGGRAVSPRFADAGTAAFERLDIRHPSGRPYRRDELFRHVPVFTSVDEISTDVVGVA